MDISQELEDKLVASFTEDLVTDRMDEAAIEKVFDEMSKIERIEEMLLNQIKMDRVRFFNTKVDAQERIKGAFFRSFYLLKKIRSKKDKENALKSFKDKAEFGA